MRRFVFRSPRLGFLAVGPALARPAAAFYRRNRAAFAPFDPVQPEDFFTEEGQAERLAEELGWAEAGRSFRFLLVQPRHPGKIIGALGFNEIVRGAFQSCFVSYKIDAALWGRGYGSEAIRYGTGWASGCWGSTGRRPTSCPATPPPCGRRRKRATGQRGWPGAISTSTACGRTTSTWSSSMRRNIMHKSGSDGKFTSSIGFVLAAVGSAVGMANIWLFPYRVGQYGGGAFLIPYFLFVALFSYVGLSGEFALGRLTGTGAMGSLDYVLRQRGRRGGRVLGAIPLLGVLGIAIGYSVVVGWVLRYAAGSLTGSVLAGDAQGFFSALAVDFGSIPWHFAAVAVTAAILIFGVASGIEKLSKVMMPAFFILFLIIAVRVAFLPGAMEGYLYLLRPDWSYLLNPETWVMAMGQAFFSLSINGAGMLIYGSYMKKGENILRHAGMTAVLDTLAALLAGFAILPAVFAFGIDPTSGPQLMFVTLPQIFQQMPGGRIFALLFFVSVFFAGITSLMNMLEACGEALTSTFRLSRTVSTLLVGAAAFLPGLFLESLAGMGSWMDLITIYVSPFGALLVAVCIYFVLGMKGIRAELALGRARAPGRLFGITARFYVFLTVAVWILGIAYGGIG